MKKTYFLLAIFASFLLVNCVGVGKSIKFDTLKTKTFTLSWVNYITNMNEFNQEIPLLFDSLPINDVIKQVEIKYGITIDTSLFEDTETNKSKIGGTVLGNMAVYSVKYETTETQIVGIIFGKYYQQQELDADISLYIKENEKTIGEAKITIKVPEWDPYKK